MSQSMKNKNKMAVTILTGFLGSGKTTLLQRLIMKAKESGQKVAIIMNEFGSFDVDSNLLGDDVSTQSLLNGCICCSLKDDIEVVLHNLYHKDQPDLVLIEATGIAHPVELVDACQNPTLIDKVEMPTIIGVMDGKRYLERTRYTVQTKQLMEEQMLYSHLIIINKSDELSDEEKVSLETSLQSIKHQPVLHFTQFSNIDGVEIPVNEALSLQTKHSHHHGIQSINYTFSGPIEMELLMNFLRQLPDSILRIKGFVKFREEPEQTYLFQYAFGVPQYEPEIMNMPLTIVIIGESIDKASIRNKLDMLNFS
ncbi:CobW family GTP-binding protein [Mammaliicoccus sciuri]|uniref:CobW family GTP-binding protein n=1 Tax=Mammaliicoccus sciuri TaxID=1296 RepID=UPI00066CA567|nr:GTP-binding protein [Mammaliicoccus sciuri]MCJ0908191.1 GTP-binding protein [Mammaliicoccus sciuri]MCJ0921800.1 GTP-binding protein [Mammaliicoccus sciuri]MCJ0924487.1 GTP-binding protein [Mammaliicoccus sciuri]MCJ1760738.1 GTP-binding protein [Mammaliicoccus sciuri]MDO0950396.1 GTP-binding protein [Mammaliicoccus sciuri]